MTRKLTIMQAELEANPLVTVLAPSKRRVNEHDCIRVNVSVPPSWYRKMCSLWPSKRGVRRAKFDTIIRRSNTLKALQRLIDRKPKGTVYEERILNILPAVKIPPEQNQTEEKEQIT